METEIKEFGIKRENEERRDGGCGIVFDPKTGKFAVGRDINNRFRLFSGGIERGEKPEEGALREVVEESGLYDFLHVEKLAEVMAHFHNPLKNVNRIAHATCLLVILRSKKLQPTKLEEHEKFTLEWATENEILKNWNETNGKRDNDHWIYFLGKATTRIKELGYNIYK